MHRDIIKKRIISYAKILCLSRSKTSTSSFVASCGPAHIRMKKDNISFATREYHVLLEKIKENPTNFYRIDIEFSKAMNIVDDLYFYGEWICEWGETKPNQNIMTFYFELESDLVLFKLFL